MKSLFLRMLTTYAGIMLGLLLLLGVITTQIFASQQLSETKHEMRRELDEINAIMVEKYAYAQKRALAREELYTIVRKHNALIQVVDSQNQLWSIYDEAQGDMWAACALVDISQWTQEVQKNATLETTAFFPQGAASEVMSQGKALLNDGKVEGALFFHTSLAPVNALIRRVYANVALTCGLSIVFAFLTVYITARRFTSPLERMNATLERYSRGAYDERVEVLSLDEIGRLGSSFNEMADAIGELENMRRSFVANVSHELKSPLASMRGFLQGILDDAIPPEQHKKYLEVALEETNRLTGLVNDLLDLARIESGEMPMEPTVFDVNELLLRVLLTFEKRIEDKKINIIINFRQEHCFVKADAGMINIVTRNLIDNAIKFTPPGGSITVDTNWRREHSFIAVTDTGPGVPQEDLPFIFERFFKAEKAHTPGGGTGLGLSIVKRIIEQHGERIRAFSTSEGSRFVFTLAFAEELKRKKG